MTLADEFRLSSRGRDRLATLLPLAATLALLLAAALSSALAPHGHWGRPWIFLAHLLAAAAAATYRPSETIATGERITGALGLGTVVLPSAILLLGVVPATWVAFGAVFLSCLFRACAQVGASGDFSLAACWNRVRRSLRQWCEVASARAMATLASGGLWLWLTAELGADEIADGGPGSTTFALIAPLLAALALYLAVALGVPWLALRLRRPDLRPPWLPKLFLLIPDGAGWLVGLLVAVATGDDPWLAIGLLASFAALALEASRHALRRASAQRHIDDLEAVGQASKRMIESPHQLTSLVNRIRAECRRVLAAPWFQFELLSREGSRSWFAGPDGVLHEGVPRPGSAPPTLPGVHKRVGWRVLDYPLKAERRVLACLRLWCDPRTLKAENQLLLERLLPQMAASVHRSMLDRDAKSDALTGVAVRRVLEERLENAYQHAIEDSSPFSVVMLDLDHFKRINDVHGHDAGDQALKAFADLLQTNTRDPDLCCRYGGEEFTWLLEDTSGPTALAAAERLRGQVEELSLVIAGKPIPFTMCAGVAAFPQLHIKTASELLLLADEALYEAKNRGRNIALLNLGQGHLATADGTQLLSDNAPPPIEPPRIFA